MKQQWRAAIPVTELTEHPDNPRRGDVDAIAESIDAHGFYGAVLVQQSTGHVIAGNHRLRAAIASGLGKVPGIVIDVDDDEARRIMLHDNRTSDLGGYDDPTLLAVLRSLSELTGTGYTDAEMDRLARITAASESDWTADAAWDGMPDYSSENRLAKFKVSVYFSDKGDVEPFFKLIDREVTTRLWWPKPEDDAPGESWQYKVIVDEG